MSLKTAAFLAFIGALLAAALLTWDLVSDALEIARGLIAPVRIVASLIYAFAAVTITIFLFAVYKEQG